jgi:hypothetical protein
MLVVDVAVAGAVRTDGIGYSRAYSCSDRARKGFPAKISLFGGRLCRARVTCSKQLTARRIFVCG